MTNNQLTDERLVKILSETQATIMEHNSRCVRGSVEVDARLFESMIMELQERRKVERDSEPVAWTDAEELSDLKRDGYAAMLSLARKDCEHADPRRQILLFTHPAPESELKAIVERLNASGYECGDSPVTTRNAAAVVDILLQQLDDAVQGSRLQRAPVVPEILPCSVELKPGLILGKGCKTATLLMALQSRADYRTEIDAMTPGERAEHDASIEAFKVMLNGGQS